MLGFTRISDTPITDHSQVYTCDCVIVLDETLCEVTDVAMGLKSDGVLLLNTQRSEAECRALAMFQDVPRLVAIDATKIALECLGAPIVNTVMLGAAAAVSGLVALPSLEAAVDGMMAPALREKNKTAIRTAYEQMKEVR